MFKGKHAEKVRFVIIPTGDRRKSGIQGQCLVRYPSGSEDYHTCRIDTGANHTVIPEEFWKEHISRADLQRLGHPMTINRLGHQLNGFKLSLSIEISGTDDAVFHRFIECNRTTC